MNCEKKHVDRPIFDSNELLIKNRFAKISSINSPFPTSFSIHCSEDGVETIDYHSNIKAYKVNDKKQFLLYLKYPCEFQLTGHLKLTCLYGSISIYGYTLSPPESIQLYSNYITGSYSCKANIIDSDMPSLSKIINENVCLTENDTHELLKTATENDTLLLLESLDPPPVYKASVYLTSRLYDIQATKLGEFKEMSKALNCSITVSKAKHNNNAPSVIVPSEWNEIPLNTPSVITGGKNVGKSTFLKYYTNKFLNKSNQVLVVDLDPGQPEFTYPGSISVILITEPIFGSNYMHVRKCERILHFGSVDVASYYQTYCEAVTQLFDFCKSNYPNLPWIVNTMGFNKGLSEGKIKANTLKYLLTA